MEMGLILPAANKIPVFINIKPRVLKLLIFFNVSGFVQLMSGLGCILTETVSYFYRTSFFSVLRKLFSQFDKLPGALVRNFAARLQY
jgi:hypothetical protein